MFRGLLGLLVGSGLIVVACDYRNVALRVWDWADLVVTRRSRWGTPWKSPDHMRVGFGIAGAVCAVLGLVSMKG
ncbi:hypothetical protein K373_02684 [Streptomyces sp. DvalAA-21]|nr:hypothetical protein SACTE_3656 [Streptomyces sp. SirexAA-E]PZX40505.1 hypothetical protein K373_02684 [Streptomyces sp. DvalAA-21]RAJ36670.1 hypothetical protein K351_02429 [Streptomyces sp. DpondAA-E10]RAJ50637.1 hypothetical protein K352_01824 [Streptomyces sp. DpondAA-A50]SCD37552.1 hypothetical protein GA0115239_101139 [Streptomyces sp. BpilaLS-43]SCE51928.1 hypothetical protein GA0115235_122722 [Streptomyces sp. DpondAA-F4a]SCM04490.1 hypothetical protein SAMN04883147_106687 [Strepto